MNCLGIFAKYWEPGKVKTRLGAAVGDAAASEVYRCFVSTLVRRFRRHADRRVLCCTPEAKLEAFIDLAGAEWLVTPQSSGDLGARMTSFFESCFSDGADRVVLIGSDSPTLPVEYVELAFENLRTKDVVLGPTDDGGYYLVGASRNVSGIFDGINWSTSQVWEQTMARLGKLGLSYDSLPQWYDVDELADLKRLRGELLRTAADTTELSELLATVERVL